MIKITIALHGHLQNCRRLSMLLVQGSTKKREVGIKINISLSPMKQFEGLYTLRMGLFQLEPKLLKNYQRTLKVAASRF